MKAIIPNSSAHSTALTFKAIYFFYFSSYGLIIPIMPLYFKVRAYRNHIFMLYFVMALFVDKKFCGFDETSIGYLLMIPNFMAAVLMPLYAYTSDRLSCHLAVYVICLVSRFTCKLCNFHLKLTPADVYCLNSSIANLCLLLPKLIGSLDFVSPPYFSVVFVLVLIISLFRSPLISLIGTQNC